MCKYVFLNTFLAHTDACWLMFLFSYFVLKALNIRDEAMVPENACILERQINCTAGGSSTTCDRPLRSVNIGTPCDGPNSDSIAYVRTLSYCSLYLFINPYFSSCTYIKSMYLRLYHISSLFGMCIRFMNNVSYSDIC